MFDIVFVYLRVIVLVIMSEWISRLCTFVHVCARITRGTYLQSQGEFSQFGGILSIWFGMDQICYNLVRWKCVTQYVQLLIEPRNPTNKLGETE